MIPAETGQPRTCNIILRSIFNEKKRFVKLATKCLDDVPGTEGTVHKQTSPGEASIEYANVLKQKLSLHKPSNA